MKKRKKMKKKSLNHVSEELLSKLLRRSNPEKKMSKLKISRWSSLTTYLSKFEIGNVVSRKEILRAIYTRKIPGGFTTIDSYLILLKGSEYINPVDRGKYIILNKVPIGINYNITKDLYTNMIHTKDPLTTLFKNWKVAELIEKNKET